MANSNHLNRRSWLKRSFAISSGLAVAGGLTANAIATPLSGAEESVTFDPASPLIRLNANENPYGPSDKARQAILKAVAESNRYPFDRTTELKEKIAAREGVTVEHIHLGAGSGELLGQTGKAFAANGGSVVSAFPTFPILMNHAESFGARWIKVPVNSKLEHDFEAMASAVSSDTSLVFVCNPNNPTGTLVDPAVVKAFCSKISERTTVYSDEAYLEFLKPEDQQTMVSLVLQNKPVIVSRTFSKIHGLAGLRLGYLVGRPDLIARVAKYAGDIPLSQPAVAAALACMDDKNFASMCRDRNATARGILERYLEKRGLTYGRSYTNFLFFQAPAEGKHILSVMKDKGYLIRIWDFGGKEWCRVSIGTEQEMKGFVSAFQSAFG